MEKLNFHQWLTEVADFGFDRPRPVFNRNAGNLPVYKLQVEYITKQLLKHNMGCKKANESVTNGVYWGDGFGAIRVNFSPARGLRVSIQRQSTNIKGEATWICKKVIDITDYYCKFPDALVMKILDEVKIVEGTYVEVGVNNYKNLEALVKRMALYVDNKMTQRIFTYEGIREVHPDREYVIHWGVTGMGVQRKDQKRLDQYQIVVKYDEETGFLTIGTLEVGGPIRGHAWAVDPCNFFEFFSPAQDVVEICNSVLIGTNNY